MFRFIRFIKYGIFITIFGRIFNPVTSTNLVGSQQIAESSQSTPEAQADPFKTTFDGDYVNLDLNAMHGYTKFTCNIEYTKVTYQSDCKFKSALDGDYNIWTLDGSKYAFRFTSLVFDKKPLSLMIEFDRNNKSTALYYRKKYNSTEWEKIDEPAHTKFVDDFNKALKAHKDGIQNDSETSVDLELVIDSNGIDFSIHKYKSGAEIISAGTAAALAAKEPIDTKKYNLTNHTNVDASGPKDQKSQSESGVDTQTKPQESSSQANVESTDTNGGEGSSEPVLKLEKKLELELTDKKYRIVKVKIKSHLSYKSDLWETGGSAFCTKLVAFVDDNKYRKFILTLVYKDSGKKTEMTLESDRSYYMIYKVNEVSETDILPTFDFQY